MCIIFNQWCFIVCVNFLLLFLSFVCNGIHCMSSTKKKSTAKSSIVFWAEKFYCYQKKLLPSLLLLLSSTPSVFSQLISFLSYQYHQSDDILKIACLDMTCVYVDHDSWKWKWTIFALSMIYLPFTFPLLSLWSFFFSLYLSNM